MDKETKAQFKKVDKRFEKMDQKFEELLLTVKQGFDELGEKMDRFEAKIELDIDALRMEVREISHHVEEMDKKLEKVKIRTKEDDAMIIKDYIKVKKQLQTIEKTLLKHGIKIPAMA